MSSPGVRPRAAQALALLAFLSVAALLGLLAWRLTPPEGPPLQRARRSLVRGAVPDDACLVLITIDGLRTDRLGSYGEAPLSPTSHIDRLASEGFLFEQAITPVPASFPAHAALMTGFSPAGRPGLNDPAGALAAGRATLAEILRSSGFTTAAFVGSAEVGRATGLARGFDRFDDPRVANRPATVRWLAQRPAREVIDAARAWLDENFRRRFFLWVQLADPTPPHDGGPRSPRRRDPYDVEVEATDAEIGRLLSRLASLGVMTHTIVAVAGSHGDGLGEHGETWPGFGLYDTTLRVPMIVRLPGLAARDRSIPEQVRLYDLTPTLLDLLRLAAPERPDGVSLVPLLDPGGTLAPLPAVAEAGPVPAFLGLPARRALRDAGWKLINGPAEELYDLRRDPSETRNLASAQTGRLLEMRQALAAAWPAGAAPGSPAGEVSGRAAVTVPPAAPALLAEGLGALRLGDGARARRALEDLRRSLASGRPEPPWLLALLGAAFRMQGRLQESLDLDGAALEGLTAGSPDGAAPPLAGLLHSEIGACRRLQGQSEAALDAYRLAVRARPDDIDDRLALADLLVETGAPDPAIDELRAALARAPGEATLLAGLGRAYLAAGQPAAAILPLQDALRAAPVLTRPFFDLGRAYEALGRPTEALRAYQDFQARIPGHDDALYEEAGARVRALQP
jgi:arylsulfatase A-like enzyme/Flp pilus assembly protein TadD